MIEDMEEHLTSPIPTAGETTIIGLPAVHLSTMSHQSDRALDTQDLATLAKLHDNCALLFSTRGAIAGSRYLLDQDLVRTGRDAQADIFLDDSTVSRQHAVFSRQNDEFYVEDSGSLNGTYVNRQRIVQRTLLHNGDEIMIGKFRLIFFKNSALQTLQ